MSSNLTIYIMNDIVIIDNIYSKNIFYNLKWDP